MKKLKKLCSLFLSFSLLLSLIPISQANAEEEPNRWWESAGDAGITNDASLPGRTTIRDGWQQSYYFAPMPAGSVFLFEYSGTPVVSGETFKFPATTFYGEVVTITGAMNQRPVFQTQDRLNLTGVELPNNGRLGTLGNDSFRDCVNLSEVILPDTLNSIGLRAFQGCSSLSRLVIPPSVTGIGKDAFKDTAPDFTIYGVPGTAAHLYASYYQIPFVSSAAEFLTLELPEMTNHQTIDISGFANTDQVQIYVNDILLHAAAAVDNYTYTASVHFPEEGDYTIKVTADYGGQEVTVTKTISYDANLPELLSFYAYSEAHNSTGPVNLNLPGAVLPILWHQNGCAYTFEIQLDELSPVTKVYVVSERNGERKTMEANWDANKQMWIASGFFDPTDLSYVPGKLSLWCEWGEVLDGSDLLSGLGEPDRDSNLLPGVGARAFIPADNSANGTYQKLNPNSGKNNLAPGLSVITNKGSQQWTIVVEEAAVGKKFIFWAHAGGNTAGEFIFVTFPAAGRYNIGSENGMQHMALVQHEETPVRSGIIADGKCRVIIDPSGYVFEAVPSNRLSGVQTTIYYMGDENGTLIDRYAETPAGNAYSWNAEEFEQENPLFTDSDGVYAWDVPDGWWQVKYELDGYETLYSEWMPVPPEQREVNVGMVSEAAPIVTQVNGYPAGIEITFSKYMKLDTLLSENFTVTLEDGTAVSGRIEFVNAENNQTESAQYASILRFIPDQELSGQIRLAVSPTVASYAGTEMTQPYTETITIRPEPKSISAENIHLSYEQTGTMTVRLEPAEAVAGMTLKAVSAQPYIASVAGEAVAIDENGEAVLQITGNLPGTARINLALPDTLLQTQTDVTVGLPNQFDYEVENISVLSEDGRHSISTLDGTLRMTAAVLPVNATNRAVTWSVENETGKAVIDNSGLLTAVGNGTVTVKAAAKDGSGTYNTLQINISGQAPVIKGTKTMHLIEGYQPVSTEAYRITGKEPIFVEKTAGDAKITWNSTTKKLDIAAGLKAGSYPVTLKVTNGNLPDAEFTFTLTVTAAPTLQGPEAMELTEGYAAISTNAYTVTGSDPINISKISGHEKITWNHHAKKLHIAAGLKRGDYPVVLKAANEDGEATLTFILKVKPIPVPAPDPTPAITSVSISPASANVVKGKTRQFSAKVTGTHAFAPTVIWQVSGNKKAGTKISAAGMLTVAANETAGKLTVTAASAQDKTKYARATVKLVDPLSISPAKAKAVKGKTKQFSAKIEGKKATAKAVKWKVSGHKKKGTKISQKGKLTVAANETAKKLTVTVSLAKDKKKIAKAAITVVKPQTAKPDKKAAPTSRKVKKGRSITLKAPKNTTLYYTLNGKKPSLKSAKVKPGQSKKITIRKKTTLNIFAKKKNYRNSNVVTRIYKVR